MKIHDLMRCQPGQNEIHHDPFPRRQFPNERLHERLKLCATEVGLRRRLRLDNAQYRRIHYFLIQPGRAVWPAIVVSDLAAQDSHTPHEKPLLKPDARKLFCHGQKSLLDNVLRILGVHDSHRGQFSEYHSHPRQLFRLPIVQRRNPPRAQGKDICGLNWGESEFQALECLGHTPALQA